MYKYRNPVSTIFGAGSLGLLPDLVAGRTVLLLTFPEARELKLIDRVKQMLGSSLIAVECDTKQNPDISDIADLYAKFWRGGRKFEVIVAIGGGSTLDTAKNLMVGTRSGEYAELLESIRAGTRFDPPETKTLIAVPTTAGTGSEVTPWASVWDHSIGKKYSLHLAQTWADTALVDPELSLTLPGSITLSTGLDALSHSLEAVWNRNANPVSDALAVSAAKQMMEALPHLVKDLGSIKLRAAAAGAALKAGLAFSNTKTALAHSISYQMTLDHGLPHGIACSFSLPLVLDMAIGRLPDRDKVLSSIFPCELSQASIYLKNFLQALGVKTEFSDYGVSSDESKEMIRGALEGARGKNFIAATM